MNLSGKAVKDKEFIHMTYINKYGLKLLSQYPVKERADFLTDDTFIKFLVVRHPYDRLLSAYADKFVKVKNFVTNVKKAIKKRFRNDTEAPGVVTVKEYFTHLSDSYNKIRDRGPSEHWLTYTDLCQPCQVNYDLILKLETSQHDTHLFINTLMEKHPQSNLTKFAQPPVLNPTKRKAPSPIKHLEEAKGTPTEVLSELYKLYQDDFEMFGYTFDTESMTAKCVDNDSRGCCWVIK